MTQPDQLEVPSAAEQQLAEAAAWFESWRERAQGELLPPARGLSDEEVNALVHELR